MPAKDTLHSIRDHFLILLSLILADVALKAVLKFQSLLDEVTVNRLNAILSYFLISITVIFALFASVELTLHAIKSVRDTASRLFPKTADPQIVSKVSGEQQ